VIELSRFLLAGRLMQLVKEWTTVIALLGTDFLPLSRDLDFFPLLSQ
jgi:hypothetical protein